MRVEWVALVDPRARHVVDPVCDHADADDAHELAPRVRDRLLHGHHDPP